MNATHVLKMGGEKIRTTINSNLKQNVKAKGFGGHKRDSFFIVGGPDLGPTCKSGRTLER